MKLPTLRPFEFGDLDACVGMYLDAAEALGGDAWSENAVAKRLESILESPAFKGYVWEVEGEDQGFLLGRFSQAREGMGFDLLELVVKPGEDRQAAAEALLEGAVPLLKAKGVRHIRALSSPLLDSRLIRACGFGEVPEVKLFERKL